MSRDRGVATPWSAAAGFVASGAHKMPGQPFLALPSDTKLLLTKNYSEILIFKKLRNSHIIL